MRPRSSFFIHSLTQLDIQRFLCNFMRTQLNQVLSLWVYNSCFKCRTAIWIADVRGCLLLLAHISAKPFFGGEMFVGGVRISPATTNTNHHNEKTTSCSANRSWILTHWPPFKVAALEFPILFTSLNKRYKRTQNLPGTKYGDLKYYMILHCFLMRISRIGFVYIICIHHYLGPKVPLPRLLSQLVEQPISLA